MTEFSAAAPGRRGAAAQGRSAARLAAVQALYQIEMTGDAPDHVLLEFLQHRLDEVVDDVRLAEADRRLFCELVRGAAATRDELDDMLSAVLDEDWPVERLETLLRALLRTGTHELSTHADVPGRVIITEYVHVADAFFSGKEPAMVNGILDRLARALRPEEFNPTAPAPTAPRGRA